MTVNTVDGPRSIAAGSGGWKTNRGNRRGRQSVGLKGVFSERWERAMPCQENFSPIIG